MVDLLVNVETLQGIVRPMMSDHAQRLSGFWNRCAKGMVNRGISPVVNAGMRAAGVEPLGYEIVPEPFGDENGVLGKFVGLTQQFVHVVRPLALVALVDAMKDRNIRVSCPEFAQLPKSELFFRMIGPRIDDQHQIGRRRQRVLDAPSPAAEKRRELPDKWARATPRRARGRHADGDCRTRAVSTPHKL
ncbi:MAG: hypothetical protein ACKOJB_11025 [Chthoniobacterales bacterium]